MWQVEREDASDGELVLPGVVHPTNARGALHAASDHEHSRGGYVTHPPSGGDLTMWDIIGIIIAGIIIGLLGKFLAPGDKDNTPLWLTVACGVGGVLIGLVIYRAFGGNGSLGIDWTRWVVSIICAAILVVIASTVTGRNTSKRG
jgi:uncharacterized membrane protein YeaQ/YmgE (transglycosylase-associated protein family)